MRLRNYIRNLFAKRISSELNQDELLVRSVLHPFHYSESKKVLVREAFLPRIGKNDVSLLRHKYTTDDFCKKHSMGLIKNIPDAKYIGLGIFLARSITQIKQKNPEIINAIIKVSPMRDESNYYDEPFSLNIYSEGLPMHADLLYPAPLEKGIVQTNYREFAQLLVKESQLHVDPNPLEKGQWMGPHLKWCHKNLLKSNSK